MKPFGKGEDIMFSFCLEQLNTTLNTSKQFEKHLHLQKMPLFCIIYTLIIQISFHLLQYKTEVERIEFMN